MTLTKRPVEAARSVLALESTAGTRSCVIEITVAKATSPRPPSMNTNSESKQSLACLLAAGSKVQTSTSTPNFSTMDNNPHLAQFYVQWPTVTCYRVCSDQSRHPSCPQSINVGGTIAPRGQWAHPTLNMAERYLSWDHVDTPWVALFNKLAPALQRALWLQRQGVGGVYIAIVDTYNLNGGELLDAHALAHSLEFTERDRDRRRRLENHRAEYLFYGSIRADRIMVTVPAMGTARTFWVHLGKMAIPTSFLIPLAPRDGEGVKNDIVRSIAEQGAERNLHWDDVKTLQVVHALCQERYD